MSEQPGKPTKAGEAMPRAGDATPKASRSYPEILQLNQELFKNLQSLIDEDEARKKELVETKNAYEMGQAEIARLERELRQSIERESDRAEELNQLEQERVDQLGAMSAHLDAMRSAVERYMQQGRRAA
jgi:predicted nuclease with TOPRIM domain